MKKLVAFVAVLMAFPSLSVAETYCLSPGGRFFGGGEFDRTWTVSTSTVRKPVIAGATRPTTGCSYTFSAQGGMTKPAEILTQPSLGRLSV
jgi:hypothetical protein